MSDDMDLVEEMRNALKDEHRKALVDAYLEDPDVDSVVNKALALLKEAVDEIQEH
jgi:hypothetical protein